MTVRAGVGRARRRRRPRVTTVATRPRSSPSNRTSSGPDRARTGSGKVDARCRGVASAARGVTSPSRSLPGQTGWISAAPVATTISSASTWSMPSGRPRDDRRARVDADDLDRRRAASRIGSPSRAAARPARPPPIDDALGTTRRSTADVASRRRRIREWRVRDRSDAARRRVPGRAATWHVRTYATPIDDARGSCRNRRRGTGVPPRPGASPARTIAMATVSPCPDRDRPAVDDDRRRRSRPLGHSRIRQPVRVEQRLGLEPRRPAAADDLDLEAVAARAVRRRRAPRARTRARCDWPDVVAVAARGDPADDLVVVPDRLVADDVGRVVRVGLDDERDEPSRRGRPRARAS